MFFYENNFFTCNGTENPALLGQLVGQLIINKIIDYFNALI